MTTNPPPAAGAAPEPSTADAPPNAEFFDQIRATGVVRPHDGRWVAGVAAGLARRWGVDPLLVRGLIVAAVLLAGIGAAFYGVAWLLFQQQDGRIHAQEVLRGRVSAGFFGAVLLILVDLPGPLTGWGGDREFGPFGFGGPFSTGPVVLAIAVGVWWFTTRGPGRTAAGPLTPVTPVPPVTPSVPVTTVTPSGAVAGARTGEEERPAPPEYGFGYRPVPSQQPGPWPAPWPDPEAPLHGLTRAALGLAVLAFGGVLVYDRFTDDSGVHLSVAFALALAAVALGVVVAGALGRRPGGLAPIAVLLAALAIGAQVLQGASVWGNQVTWHPTSLATAQAGYDLGVGQAVLDLTGPPPADSAVFLLANDTGMSVPVHLGMGTLTVVVPDDVTVTVQSSVGLGGIEDGLTGSGDRRGPGSESSVTTGDGQQRYVVIAEVGVGTIRLVPESRWVR